MKSFTSCFYFDGNCREAMTFYGKCLGAELHLQTFAQVPGYSAPLAEVDRIVHARLTRGAEPILMASDTMPGMPLQQGNNFAVSIECESNEEVDKLFAALGENGKVGMPVQDMFWGARFGTLTDQFGIRWMFNFQHTPLHMG